ncbi:MAG: hypothetical protein IIU06_01115 [Erysipelotrichales bacterium]|nr:hypothetical protein [Erysipelotrichales bacterium]
MEKTIPLRITCTSCGSPLGFDIVHQTYACRFCGRVMSDEESKNQVQKWRDRYRIKAKSSAAEITCCDCPSCGSRVIFPSEEASETCDYCGSKLVRHEFLEEETLPELIIPFTFTAEEAKKRLLSWTEKHPLKKEARRIRQNIEDLKEYYLPYDIMRGKVNASASRDNGKRKYYARGFIESAAVVTSRQFSNPLLDKVEPYDWAAAEPFHLGYVTGPRVRIPNLTKTEKDARVTQEIEEIFLPEVEKTLQTTGVDVDVSTKDLFGVSALLPVYYLRAGEYFAVMNGQTGRIAVTDFRKKKTYPWVLEPLFYTILSTVLLSVPYRFAPEAVCLFAAVFACIYFSVFSEGRNSLIRRIITQSEKARALRENEEIRFIEGKDVLQNTFDNTPVFVEKDKNGEEVPVKIRFYTPGRIVKMILSMVLTIGLPVLPAGLIHLAQIEETGEPFMENFHWQYGGAWYIIAVFLCILYWIKGMRIDVYDHPLFWRIMDDGSYKRMRSPDSRMGGILSMFGVGEIDDNGHRVGLLRLLWSMGGLGAFLGITLLVILIGSTAAIIG